MGVRIGSIRLRIGIMARSLELPGSISHVISYGCILAHLVNYGDYFKNKLRFMGAKIGLIRLWIGIIEDPLNLRVSYAM